MRELREWQEFDAYQPIGARRADFHFAMLMAQQSNMHRAKNAAPRKVSDFMVFEQQIEKKQEAQKLTKPAADRAVISMDTVVYLFAAARKASQLQDGTEVKSE